MRSFIRKQIIVIVICAFLASCIIPIGNIGHIEAAGVTDGKYSMAYVYFGSVSTQINYVEQTKGAVQTVSPSGWFNLNADGTLQTPTNRTQFVTRMHELGIR